MNKNCKKCSTALSDRDKFCTECGTPVPQSTSKLCVCGTEFIPDAKFCMKCGAANPTFKSGANPINPQNTPSPQQNYQQPPQQNFYAHPPQQPVKPMKKSGSGCLIAILVLVFLFIAGSVLIYFFVIKPNWQEFGFDELFAKNKTEIQLAQQYV